MSYLDHVTTGVVVKPHRVVIHGKPKVGKTTWAAGWPNPVVVPTEDGSFNVDVPRGPKVQTRSDLAVALKEVSESQFDTIILDSADWAEKILQKELDASGFDQGYGRGAVEIGKQFAEVLDLLDLSWQAGKHVVVIAHSKVTKMDNLDGSSYSFWGPCLSKKSTDYMEEWADAICYAQRDFAVIGNENPKKPGVGVDRKTRTLYTSPSATFMAGTRVKGMPPKLALGDVSSYVDFVTNAKKEEKE